MIATAQRTPCHVTTPHHLNQRTSLTIDDEIVWIMTDLDGLARQVKREDGQIIADAAIDAPVAAVLRGAGWAVSPWGDPDDVPAPVVVTNDPFFAPPARKGRTRSQLMIEQLTAERNARILRQAAPPRETTIEPTAQETNDALSMAARLANQEIEIAQLRQALQQVLGQPAPARSNVEMNQLPREVDHVMPDGQIVTMVTQTPPTADEVTGVHQERPEEAEGVVGELAASPEEAAVARAITSRGRGNKRKEGAIDPLDDIPVG